MQYKHIKKADIDIRFSCRYTIGYATWVRIAACAANCRSDIDLGP